MYNIVFLSDAIKDLDELCNEQAAIKTVSEILKNIRMLSQFPESGALLSLLKR